MKQLICYFALVSLLFSCGKKSSPEEEHASVVGQSTDSSVIFKMLAIDESFFQNQYNISPDDMSFPNEEGYLIDLKQEFKENSSLGKSAFIPKSRDVELNKDSYCQTISYSMGVPINKNDLKGLDQGAYYICLLIKTKENNFYHLFGPITFVLSSLNIGDFQIDQAGETIHLGSKTYENQTLAGFDYKFSQANCEGGFSIEEKQALLTTGVKALTDYVCLRYRKTFLGKEYLSEWSSIQIPHSVENTISDQTAINSYLDKILLPEYINQNKIHLTLDSSIAANYKISFDNECQGEWQQEPNLESIEVDIPAENYNQAILLSIQIMSSTGIESKCRPFQIIHDLIAPAAVEALTYKVEWFRPDELIEWKINEIETNSFFLITLLDKDGKEILSQKETSQKRVTRLKNSSLIVNDFYQIKIKSIDSAGNSSKETIGPKLQLKTSKVPTVNKITLNPQFDDGFLNAEELTHAHEVVLDIEANHFSEIKYRLSLASEKCHSVDGYSAGAPIASNRFFFDEGSYKICAKLIGTENNILYSESSSFIFDPNAPEKPSFTLLNKGFTNHKNLSVDFDIQDAAFVSVSLEPDCIQPFTPIEKSKTISIETKSNGSFPISVQFKDAAGNEGACISQFFVHDDTPPTLGVAKDFPNKVWGGDASPYFGWEEATDNFSGVSYYSAELKDAQNNLIAQHRLDSSEFFQFTDISLQAEQSYHVSLKAFDFAGNVASVDSYTFSPFLLSSNSYLRGDQTSQIFGYRMALSNDLMVVGNPLYNNRRGMVSVFRKVANTWVLEYEIKQDQFNSDSSFGAAVAISEDMIAVGAPAKDYVIASESGCELGGCWEIAGFLSPGAGAVYIYNKGNNNQWTLQQEVFSDSIINYPYSEDYNYEFGFGLAMDQGLLAVAAPLDPRKMDGSQGAVNSGMIHLYALNDNSDTFDPIKLLKPNEVFNTKTGHGVGVYNQLHDWTQTTDAFTFMHPSPGPLGPEAPLILKGNDLIIGLPNDNLGLGAVAHYRLTRGEGNPIYTTVSSPTYIRPTTSLADEFGAAIALSENRIAISAAASTDLYPYSGDAIRVNAAVYIYERTAVNDWSLTHTVRPTLVRQDKKNGNFTSVDLAGDFLLIGDPYDWDYSHAPESLESTANKDRFKGKSYLYQFNSSSNLWDQISLFEAFDDLNASTDRGMLFGAQTKMIGNDVYISAPYASSGSANDVGAIYHFIIEP